MLPSALGPPVVWWAFRRAGVRQAFLSTLVAAVAFLLAAGALLDQVRLLAGDLVSFRDSPAGPVVGVRLGLAVLADGLALQGPRRWVR